MFNRLTDAQLFRFRLLLDRIDGFNSKAFVYPDGLVVMTGSVNYLISH